MKREYKNIVWFLALICWFGSLIAQDFAIASFEVNPDLENNLRYDAEVSLTGEARVYLSYTQLGTIDAQEQYTHITEASNFHEIKLIGLKSGKSYLVKAEAFNESGRVVSEETIFQAGELPPDVVGVAQIQVSDPQAQHGFIMADSFGPVPPQVRIIDREGSIIWYTMLGNEDGTQRCQSYRYITDERTILSTECHTIRERTLEGELIAEVTIPGDKFLHHDVMKNSNGNYVAIFAEAREIDKSSVGGAVDALVVGDGLIEKTPDGETVWTWSPFDHFDPLESDGSAGYWSAVFGGQNIDWLHCNSVDQDTDGNYLVSHAEKNRVVKVSAETGEVLWTMGEGGIVTFDPEYQFIYQHAVNRSNNGGLMLYDNRGAGVINRALEFNVDEESLTAELNWSYTLESTMFSPILSSAYRLFNNHVLLCAGVAGQIMEILPPSNIVWSAQQSSGLYRSYYVPVLYKQSPEIEFTLPEIICENSGAIGLIAEPSGGYFTINDELYTSSTFDPQELGPGAYNIQYNFGYNSKNMPVIISELSDIELEIVESNSGTSLSIVEVEGASYQWYKDDFAIENSNAFTLENIEEEGIYTVSVTTIEGGCTIYSDPYSLMLGISILEDFKNQNFITPNPFTDYLIIDSYFLEAGSVEFSLFNLQGKQIYQTLNHSGKIDLELLSINPGIYFAQIKFQGSFVTQKLVKK